MRLRRADEGVFSGLLASASARPQRSEESQADGCPRPASEGVQARPSLGSLVSEPAEFEETVEPAGGFDVDAAGDPGRAEVALERLQG